QRLCQGLRLVEDLRERERALEMGTGALVLAAEEEEASKLGRDRGDIRFRARRLQRRESRLEALGCAWRVTLVEVDVGQERGHSCGGDWLVELLVGGVGALEQGPRLVGLVGAPGHLPSPVRELGTRELLVDELGRLLEVALGLCGGSQPRCSLARA